MTRRRLSKKDKFERMKLAGLMISNTLISVSFTAIYTSFNSTYSNKCESSDITCHITNTKEALTEHSNFSMVVVLVLGILILVSTLVYIQTVKIKDKFNKYKKRRDRDRYDN